MLVCQNFVAWLHVTLSSRHDRCIFLRDRVRESHLSLLRFLAIIIHMRLSFSIPFVTGTVLLCTVAVNII